MSVSHTDSAASVVTAAGAGERRNAADITVRDFMTSGQAEVTYRVLAAHFPGVDREDVADAVAEGVASYYSRALDQAVDDANAYVYVAGWNQLARRTAIRSVRLDDLDEIEDPARDHLEPTPERRALRAVLDLVERWETGRERAVIKIAIEAADEGIQLTAGEIADLLKAQGVGELSAATIRVHKSRGLARLRRDVVAMGVDLTALEPAPDADDQEEEYS